MVRQTVAVCIFCSLISATLNALDLEKALNKAAADRPPPSANASAEEHKTTPWPGLSLVCAGTVAAIIGFKGWTGTKSAKALEEEKALGATGVGLAAGGGYLLWKWRKNQNGPSLTFGPGRFAIAKSIRF